MEKLFDLQYDWLHSKIIHDSPEKLYQLAAVKTSVCLWKAAVAEDEKQTKIEVQQNIKSLSLPKNIENNLAEMTELMEEQALDLKDNIRISVISLRTTIKWPRLKGNIRWSSQGTIDILTTAETLADDIELRLEVRFEIAVSFCLQDRVNSLSALLPSYHLPKDSYSSQLINAMDGARMAKRHFGIQNTAPDYFQLFNNEFTVLSWYYYWQRLSEHEKLITVIGDENGKTYGSTEKYLFVFTQLDQEKKIQLLQNKWLFYCLACKLINVQWLGIFDSCKNYLLQFLTAENAVSLLDKITEKLNSTIVYQKKYIEISAMLLQFVCKKCSASTLHPQFDKTLIQAMTAIMNGGEQRLDKLMLVKKDFLETVGNEWIRRQFFFDETEIKLISQDTLCKFISLSLQCGMEEFVIRSALPTTEERRLFLVKDELTRVISSFILWGAQGSQMEGIDRVLAVLCTDIESVQSFKKRFAKNHGISICKSLLSARKWQVANHFVRWSYDSEEEIFHFYDKFNASTKSDTQTLENEIDTVRFLYFGNYYKNKDPKPFTFFNKFIKNVGINIIKFIILLDFWDFLSEETYRDTGRTVNRKLYP